MNVVRKKCKGQRAVNVQWDFRVNRCKRAVLTDDEPARKRNLNKRPGNGRLSIGAVMANDRRQVSDGSLLEYPKARPSFLQIGAEKNCTPENQQFTQLFLHR